MAFLVEGGVGEVVGFHYFTADEAFEGKGREHVEAEAAAGPLVTIGVLVDAEAGLQAGYVDCEVVGWEVVEDVALGFVSEGEEA